MTLLNISNKLIHKRYKLIKIHFNKICQEFFKKNLIIRITMINYSIISDFL